MDQVNAARDSLWDEALELLMQLKANPADPVLRAAAELWRERSAAHAEAWRDAVGLDGMMGVAVRNEARGKVTRRQLLAGAGLLACGGVLTAALGPRLLLQAQADYITVTAEVRPVPLADGTVVTLGPDSAISHAFTEGGRRIRLLAGLAFFDVAHDPSRPFTVSAGAVRATALGTAFEVAMDPGRTAVTVDAGLVSVDGPEPAEIKLAAGEWLSVGSGAGDTQRGSRAGGSIAAWRRGQLVASGERVADLIARMARWQGGNVILADADLGNEVVSGVFNLHQPQLALEAVVQPFGGTVRQFSPLLTVISKI